MSDAGADGATSPLRADVIAREAFEGEWWYAPTIARVEGSVPALGPGSASAPFIGAFAVADPRGGDHELARVRFEESESALSVRPVRADGSLGDAIAAFAIVERVDLDPVTGEPVRDRPERERAYLRVDWTRNAVPPSGVFGASLEASESMLRYRPELSTADPTDEALAPRLERVRDETSARRRAEWPSGSGDVVHAISAGSAERWACEPGCDPLEVTRRHAFWRIAPGHSYAAERFYADEQERFALLLTSRETAGETIALRARRALWAASLGERSCAGDAECGPASGSRCDPVARRCTIPLRDREAAPLALTLPPDYPAHLVRGAFEAVAQWNEALMAAQRELSARALPRAGAPVLCQRDDPTAYCFCGVGARAPEVGADDRCGARTDWFARPEARGEASPYECWIDGPADVASPGSPADYGAEAYGLRFAGEECLLTIEIGAAELGDLRVSALRYVPDAGFCAVAQPRIDPLTAEVITAAMHVGGGCIDALGDVADQLWPVLRGEAPEDELFGDPAFRGYFDRIRRTVSLPSGSGGGAPDPSPLTVRDPATPRVPTLPHLDPADPDVAPLVAAAGGELEARWMAPFLASAAAHLWRDDPVAAARLGVGPGGSMTDEAAALDALSPLRAGPARAAVAADARDRLLAHHLVFHPRFAHYAAGPQRWWARAFTGRPLGEARLRWQQAIHRALVARLVGHALGLAPNLAASLDRDHYPDAWFAAALEEGLPQMEDFDVDGNGTLDGLEGLTWRQRHDEVRRARLDRGLGNVASASVLDVHGDLSDLAGVGRYDRAAIFFDYFDRVEVIEAPLPLHDERGSSNDGLLRSDLHGRRLWRWYGGGEACSADADCAFSQGSAALAAGQRVHQRCVVFDAMSPIPAPCTGDGECECSSLEVDLLDYIEGFGPPSYYDGSSWAQHYPVEYLACAPGDIERDARCNLDDAGEDIRSVIAHQRDTWRELYPFTHAVPARAPSPTPRSFTLVVRLQQSMFARYFDDPRFRVETGPLGFTDHYVGVITGLDWLGELAMLPDVGGYRVHPERGVLERVTDAPDAADVVGLRPGFGFAHAGSARRLGVDWDRVVALTFVVQREVGGGGGVPTVSLSDLFAAEGRELLSGAVTGAPGMFGPHVVLDAGSEAVPLYPFRQVGTCRDPATGELVYCRDPLGALGGTTALDASSDPQRRWAAALAMGMLAPDMRALVWPLEEAEPWPEASACAVGEPLPGSGHSLCADPLDASYAVLRTATGAWAGSAWLTRGPLRGVYPEVGFALLRSALDRQAAIAALEALSTPTDDERRRLAELRARLADDEALAADLVTLARALGVTQWTPPPPEP